MCKTIDFDKDWMFHAGDLGPVSETDRWGGAKARAFDYGAAAEEIDTSKWRSIDIPHDFVVEGDYTRKPEVADMRDIPEMESISSRHFAGGSLAGGIGWYRKAFDIPSEYDGKRVYIFFDGVFRDSTVYLNHYYVGSHKSGYTGFYYDITDFVNFGGKNVIAVRVDSRGREGWWYEGGGIYRHVRLEISDSLRCAPDGVFVISEIGADGHSAELKIKTELISRYTEKKTVRVVSSVLDNTEEIVAEKEDIITVDEWDSAQCSQIIGLTEFKLWDIESPYLYTLKTTVFCDGRECDTRYTKFGIRSACFDPDNGFFLNGRRIRLHGVCAHQDHAGCGIAVPDSVWEYRFERMKSFGVNAYRCSHHAPSPVVLDICDRLGILVLDETRRMSSAPEDVECLEYLVKRDRNHPSVILWGIGNEEIFSQDRPEAERTTTTLKMAVKKQDPTRPVTSAVVCWNGQQRFDNAAGYVHVTRLLDVMGFNYCRYAWDDYHGRMSRQPIIITEAASNSWTRGCYSTDESRGRYYIYDRENESKCKSGIKAVKKDIAEHELKFFSEREYLAGIFIWTGIDYRGEPTPMDYPAVSSQFGILDYCGFEKDNYYFYKSMWTDEDVIHVFPRVWDKNEFTAYCYSNAEEAELFADGKSIGRKKRNDLGYFSWDNVKCGSSLLVKGYRNGREMYDEARLFSHAHHIELTPYRSKVSAGDTAIVNIRVCDNGGNTVLTADNELVFEISGAGSFLGCGNGDPASHEPDKKPIRRAFNGLCQLLVKADGDGVINIRAVGEGLEDGCCMVVSEQKGDVNGYK